MNQNTLRERELTSGERNANAYKEHQYPPVLALNVALAELHTLTEIHSLAGELQQLRGSQDLFTFSVLTHILCPSWWESTVIIDFYQLGTDSTQPCLYYSVDEELWLKLLVVVPGVVTLSSWPWPVVWYASDILLLALVDLRQPITLVTTSPSQSFFRFGLKRNVGTGVIPAHFFGSPLAFHKKCGH